MEMYIKARTGSMRKSNFQHSAFSCSKLGRCVDSPSRGIGATASLEEEREVVMARSVFASSGSLIMDMVTVDSSWRRIIRSDE
jgi:hypothetical protein